MREIQHFQSAAKIPAAITLLAPLLLILSAVSCVGSSPTDPEPEPTRVLTGHTDDVWSVAYSPDGQTIASGSRDDTIRIWDANTGEHLQTLQGDTDWVNSVEYSPDGQTIASGCGDNTIRIWDANTGAHIRTLQGHTDWIMSVAYSPDGQTIASGSQDATIRIWAPTQESAYEPLKGIRTMSGP